MKEDIDKKMFYNKDEKVKEYLKEINENITQKTRDLAVHYLIEYPCTHASSALATAHYINRQKTHKEAARKFRIKKGRINNHVSRMAEHFDIDKEKYQKKNKEHYNNEIKKVANKLDWEEGKHFRKLEKQNFKGKHVGNEFVLLDKGKKELFNYF